MGSKTDKKAKKAAKKALAEKLAREAEEAAKAAAEAAKKAAAEESDSDESTSSSSSSSSSNSEDEPKAPTKTEKKKDDSSSDSDSSDSEDEAPAKKVVEAKKSSDSSSSSSDSSDSEDESPAKKVVKAKKSSDSSSSSSDSSSSSSDSDSDDDTEKIETPVSKKRKAEDNVQENPPKKAAVEDDDDNKKMFIRGLPWRATQEEVEEYFKTCGEMESCELPLQNDGRSSGTAIIQYKTKDSCEACMKLNGEDFDGRWLSIKYSSPKSIMAPRGPSEKPEGCTTVFCGNLSWNIDEDSLKEAFAECGEISEIRFATDRETGEFKGFGHIEFVDSESTDKAIAMAGTDIFGRAVRVDYAADKRQGGGFGGGRGGRGGGFGGGRGGRGRGGGRDYGGSGRGGGRGRGGGGERSGGFSSAKKHGGIAAFSGNKITFD